MMVPRSYKYSSSPVRSEGQHEKGHSPKPDKGRGTSGKPEKEKKNTRPGSQSSILSPAPARPSTPVVIPTRTKQGAKRAVKGQEIGVTRRTSSSGSLHDPASTPPSTAALLAMTTIPEQGGRIATCARPRPIDGATRRVRDRDHPKRPLSSSSPQTWDFLLSPPQECILESSSFESDATTLGPFSSMRSMSTESMPSLAEDEDSTSSMSNPATPGFASYGRSERRKQSVSTSVGENCVLDHPLLPPARKDATAEAATEILPVQPRPPSSTRYKTSFKSNLTASFRAIRSAARTISDLTGPLPQRDDLLSRSVLSMDIPFTDERRPLPSSEPPDPALRRYLNPITLSPAELHFHGDDWEQTTCKSSIQMQIYQPGARRSSNASSPPVFPSSNRQRGDGQNSRLSKTSLDTEDARTSSSVPRQREPRENSDFLRVIVLEMNMRKVGKLSDASPGRARLWLPARQAGKRAVADGSIKEEVEQEGDGRDVREKRVPERWAGTRG